MRMFLYHLTRPNVRQWSDENVAFVIRAKSSRQARKIASQQYGPENSDHGYPLSPWLVPDFSKCRKIGEVTSGAKQTPDVVCRNVAAG